MKTVVKSKGKTILLALWNKFKGQRAADKVKMFIQATVATAAVGGLAVAGSALAAAQEAQQQVKQLDPTTVVTIPTPPDLTEAVEQAQQSATEAKSSADGAAASAEKAQEAADEAQDTADEALAAVPRLAFFDDVPAEGDNEFHAAGTYRLPAGTFLVHFGAILPGSSSNDQATLKLVFSDGRELKIGPTGGGYKEVRGLLTTGATTVTLYVNAHNFAGPGDTFQDIFAIFTHLNAN